MLQYTLRRLFLGLLTALLVSVIVFVIPENRSRRCR